MMPHGRRIGGCCLEDSLCQRAGGSFDFVKLHSEDPDVDSDAEADFSFRQLLSQLAPWQEIVVAHSCVARLVANHIAEKLKLQLRRPDRLNTQVQLLRVFASCRLLFGLNDDTFDASQCGGLPTSLSRMATDCEIAALPLLSHLAC